MFCFCFVCIRIRKVSGVSRVLMPEKSKLEQPPLSFFWFWPMAQMIPMISDSNALNHSIGDAKWTVPQAQQRSGQGPFRRVVLQKSRCHRVQGAVLIPIISF